MSIFQKVNEISLALIRVAVQIRRLDFRSRIEGLTLDLLETTNDGLTKEEIEKRGGIFGKNEIEEQKKIQKIRILLNQFRSPLIFLLII